MKRLNLRSAALLRSYTFGCRIPRRVERVTDRQKHVDHREMVKKVFTTDRKDDILTGLDVKNQKIFESNRENAERARMRQSASIIRDDASSTAAIVSYFCKHR